MKLFKKLAIAVALFIGSMVPAFAVDFTVTASSVVPTASTIIAHGIAGVAINAGQVVYLDASNLYQLSKANAAGTAKIAGIALNNTAANQPLSVAIAGHVTTNAGFTKGVAGYLSQANGGGIAPVADVTSGNFPVIVGIATSTTDFQIGVVNPGVSL